jgi:pyruvate-formate lyase
MMTYLDRMQALHQKKVEHTLEKTKINGYMDADDYGTIPLPANYRFEPICNLQDSICGAAANSENFEKMLQQLPVYVDPLEPMCGRWSDMLPLYRNNPFEKAYPYDDLKAEQKKFGIVSGIGADAHFACDYSIGLNLGWDGLLEKIEHFRPLHPESTVFYDAEARVIRAIQAWMQKHLDKIDCLLDKEKRPEILQSLTEMRQAMQHILHSPPRTFLEACQWIAFFSIVSRIYDRDGAGCCLDRVLYPYYLKDLRDGSLTDEKAVFILADLLLIDPHYYQLSGEDENGEDTTNHLSYLILDAAHLLDSSANLTIRIHDKIDQEFLRKGVSYLFNDRKGWPRFSGAKGLLQYARNSGVPEAYAHKRIAVGCNWMALPGLEYPLNDCVKINIARIFDLSFHEMMATDKQPSTERLFDSLEKNIVEAIAVTAKGINHHLDHQHEVMPELVMNLMMQHTLEEGQDITQCAELLTIGVDGVGLGTVADSFAALEQRIEKEGRTTWAEVYDALNADYEGTKYERLRLMLKSSQRYCQGEQSLGDRWAQRLSEMYARKVKEQTMPGSRQLIPGWFSWSSTIAFGQEVGATPDGRHKGAPITHGANPNPGFRKDGAATAMATGIARIQTNYGNTCPWQVELDPKLSVEEGGIDRVLQLLKTHVEMGGTLININILDRDTLMEAHADPMTHPDLVVRVTGFTAYFATLSPEFRQLVVDRFLDGM